MREAGDQPLQRIKLFVGYVEERSKGIHDVNADVRAQNKTVRLHNLFDEFTRLSDDLEDNMDNFNDQHEDLRKELKEVVEKSARGRPCSTSPPSNQYDFVRKTALESSQSVHDAAVQMIADEEKYFAEKKKEEKAAEKAAAKSETR